MSCSRYRPGRWQRKALFPRFAIGTGRLAALGAVHTAFP